MHGSVQGRPALARLTNRLALTTSRCGLRTTRFWKAPPYLRAGECSARRNARRIAPPNAPAQDVLFGNQQQVPWVSDRSSRDSLSVSLSCSFREMPQMNADEWNTGREKWAPLIGRLVLAFGEVEYCFMVCLGPLASHEYWPELKHSEFNKKAATSVQVLHNYDRYPESKRAMFLINEAVKRAKVRNLVAHNPLNIVPNNDLSDFHLAIGSLRNHEIHISEQELRTAMEEIEQIAAELHNIVNYIWTERE